MVEVRVAPSGRRMRLRQTGHKGQARHCLCGGSVADVVLVGAKFSYPGGLRIVNTEIQPTQFLVAEIPFVHLAGTEVLADCIGLAHHLAQQVTSLGMIEIERDAVLAWIGVVVIPAAIKVPADTMAARGSLAAAALRSCMIGRERLHVAEKVDGGWMTPFDPDYLGAETGEDASCLRTHLQPG